MHTRTHLLNEVGLVTVVFDRKAVYRALFASGNFTCTPPSSLHLMRSDAICDQLCLLPGAVASNLISTATAAKKLQTHRPQLKRQPGLSFAKTAVDAAKAQSAMNASMEQNEHECAPIPPCQF